MSFTSFSFVLFYAVCLVLFYILPHKCQKYILLLGSMFFYGLFGWKMFALLFLSAIGAFLAARVIDKCADIDKRKISLFLGVVFELAILVSLKYVVWIRDRFDLVIPIGISFYTLSIVGYLIDIYRGKYSSEKHIIDFMLYVLFFPHILQGPIARYNQLAPQFQEEKRFDFQKVTFGMQLMIWGYIKKLVIADRVAILVDAVYSDLYAQRGSIILLASVLYTIQIYMDFSGCVDIAMGVSETFGISIIQNFKQPYFANSINDFWRRWHISLSSWFRDYLYIPLGGNRKGVVRRWVNVLIVFGVSGLWHGVGLNYFVWGFLHGIYQVVGTALMPLRKSVSGLFGINRDSKPFHYLQIVITFFLVNLAWIFFRITDLKDAFYACHTIFTDFSPWCYFDQTIMNYGIDPKEWNIIVVFLAISFIVSVWHEKGIEIRKRIGEQHIIVRWFIYVCALISILLFGVYGIGYNAQSFIYMNF